MPVPPCAQGCLQVLQPSARSFKSSHGDGLGGSAGPPPFPCRGSWFQPSAASSWQYWNNLPASAFPAVEYLLPGTWARRLDEGWILPEGSGPHHLMMLV